MEEIRGTEALEREILDDSARKAERAAKKAREEAERIGRKSEGDLAAKIGEMEKKYHKKMAEAQAERISRLPLEKTRLKAAFVDRALREASAAYLAGLDDSTLGAWCSTELALRARLFLGAKVELRHRGVAFSSLKEMETTLAGSAELKLVADPSLQRRGVVVAEGEGKLLVTLTEAQMEGILLEGKRGELASALLPTALNRASVEGQTR
ncbi:MAG: hypothetical protein NT061_02005 [Spirochaetes bacterium]|nr:hypothetical protein [Spirochaetota bacterium]